MPRLLPRVDRAAHRLTGRRATVTELVVPVLMLETTARVSGRSRTTPLTYVEAGGGALAVAGSNFGKPSHPTWSDDLLADPAARVTRDGVTWPVRARLADEAERARLWPVFDRIWPVYRVYRERTAHRGIRVFILEPVA
jgi:deazaflavin-dependent oxidoreductase (nitroreductase family)